MNIEIPAKIAHIAQDSRAFVTELEAAPADAQAKVVGKLCALVDADDREYVRMTADLLAPARSDVLLEVSPTHG